MIITSISEIQEWVTLHSSMQFKVLKPFLQEAHLELIKLLSLKEYENLEAGYNKGLPNWSAYPQGEGLLAVAQKLVALKAMAVGIWDIRNHISEMGVQQQYVDDAGVSKPASVEDVKQLERNFSKRAYIAAEELLQYLELNLDPDNAIFTDWRGSQSFTGLTNCFASSVEDIAEFIPSMASRKMLLSNKPYLKAAMEVPKKLMGDLQYKQLKDYYTKKRRKDDLSLFTNQEALGKLMYASKRLVVLSGLSRGFPFLSLSFDGDQVFLQEYDAGADRLSRAHTERLTALKRLLLEESAVAEEMLQTTLSELVDELPLYAESEEWAKRDPSIVENTRSNNEGRTDFWF